MGYKQKVWEKDEYYDLAKKGSSDIDHPGMRALFKYAKKAEKILDFGCGEGTRLGLLVGKGKKLYGIDLSKKAIRRAKSKYPEIEFIAGNIKDIDIGCDFDLVYSAFVLEHTRNTEELLIELIKKLKREGILLLIAPNYGAPNRASPVAKYNRASKLITGFVKDMVRILVKVRKLGWRKVEPITDKKYEMDFDTTIEPYLGTLVVFFNSNKMKILSVSSVWERELENVKIHQKIFRLLGERGVYPFKYWGPHFLVVAEKL